MAVIRRYRNSDASQLALLIRDTYRDFNLDFLDPEEQAPFLGPSQYADSTLPEHRQAIEAVIYSDIVLVAEEVGQIIGVLRGRMNRLGSLFVRADYHHQGVATSLVRTFEDQVEGEGSKLIRVASTLYAFPFYLKLGYKKSPPLPGAAGFLAGRGFYRIRG
jgi:GNAT superfamily N-acetyltransferase